MASSTGRIRALNDDLRSSGRGGTTVITAGIAALCDDSQATIMAAVQSFTDFTPDNDPYGEHDCAVLEAAGQRVLFKIDYYRPAAMWPFGRRSRSGRHPPRAIDPALIVLTMRRSGTAGGGRSSGCAAAVWRGCACG